LVDFSATESINFTVTASADLVRESEDVLVVPEKGTLDCTAAVGDDFVATVDESKDGCVAVSLLEVSFTTSL